MVAVNYMNFQIKVSIAIIPLLLDMNTTDRFTYKEIL